MNSKPVLYLNILFVFLLIPINIMILVYPPVLLSQGQAHRIFYLHVPVAWVALYAPIIASMGGILYIFTKKRIFDIIINSSMKLTLLFSIGVVISGPLWASTEWGTYWNWKDSRLMSFFIMTIVVTTYFAVRNFTDESNKKAMYSAYMALLSMLTSVFTWLSIRILTPDTHPEPLLHTLSPKIKLTFWLSVLVYHFFFISLFYLTYNHEKLIEIYHKIRYKEEV